jgi:hypothetical protein
VRKLLVLVSFMVAACGGGAPSEAVEEAGAPSEPAQTEAPVTTAASPAATSGDGAGEAAPPPADNPGAGHISLTIGDQTWEFGGALCAYQNAPAGEAGSEWNVSYKEDDLQVYVSQDSYGPSVELTNVVDFGSLRWASAGDAVQITVDGNDISAAGTFTDESEGASSEGASSDGTLEATCASWLDAS